MTIEALANLEASAHSFLHALASDEYYLLSQQPALVAQFESFLTRINSLSMDAMQPNTGLWIAAILSKGGNIYRRKETTQDLQKALEYHQKALLLRKKFLSENALELAHSLVDLGATYNELKGAENNAKALGCYKQGLMIYERNHEKGCVASTLHKMGNALRDLDAKNIAQAIDHLNQSLTLLNTLPINEFNQRERAKILYNQGVNYHLLGDQENLKKAVSFLKDAKMLFAKLGDEKRYGMTIQYLDKIHIAKQTN
jgi:hypothetical protein